MTDHIVVGDRVLLDISFRAAVLLALYRAHPDYGNRGTASQVAAELAPQAALQAGTARSYLYAELDGGKA